MRTQNLSSLFFDNYELRQLAQDLGKCSHVYQQMKNCSCGRGLSNLKLDLVAAILEISSRYFWPFS